MSSTSQDKSRSAHAGAPGTAGSDTQTRLHRRKLDFHSWPEVFADAEQLCRTGYNRVGNWDLSQVLDHVGEGLRTAVRGSEHRGPWIIRKLIGPIVLRRIISKRRMQAGIKVPDWWLPGPAHDESGELAKFRGDVTAFERMTSKPFPHPFFGQITKAQWNDLVLIHAAHHLSFLVPRK